MTALIMSNEQFVQRLLAAAPELQPAFDEHIRYNKEVLPHVFMGDVARFVVSEVGGKATNNAVARILDFFETELAVGNEDVRGLIVLGFCENLFGKDDALAILMPQMGVHLANAWKVLCEG